MTELSGGTRAACGHYFQRPSRVLRGQFFGHYQRRLLTLTFGGVRHGERKGLAVV